MRAIDKVSFKASCSDGIIRMEFIAPHVPGAETPPVDCRGAVAVFQAMGYMARSLGDFVEPFDRGGLRTRLLDLSVYLQSLAEGELQSQRGRN